MESKDAEIVLLKEELKRLWHEGIKGGGLGFWGRRLCNGRA